MKNISMKELAQSKVAKKRSRPTKPMRDFQASGRNIGAVKRNIHNYKANTLATNALLNDQTTEHNLPLLEQGVVPPKKQEETSQPVPNTLSVKRPGSANLYLAVALITTVLVAVGVIFITQSESTNFGVTALTGMRDSIQIKPNKTEVPENVIDKTKAIVDTRVNTTDGEKPDSSTQLNTPADASSIKHPVYYSLYEEPLILLAARAKLARYQNQISILEKENSYLHTTVTALEIETTDLNNELLNLELILLAENQTNIETKTVYNFVNVPVGSPIPNNGSISSNLRSPNPRKSSVLPLANDTTIQSQPNSLTPQELDNWLTSELVNVENGLLEELETTIPISLVN